MLSKKLFQKLHYLLIFLLLIAFILVPLEYIKYIAWIPIAVVIQWIIYDGCILDKLHNKESTGNCASCLKLCNKKLGDHINKKYFKNTNRAGYITFLIFISYTTIVVYRLIYKIDVL
jgi:hypothetical protein